MTGEQAERKSKGSSISRVLEIIEAVAQAERALSPAELAFMLDIPKLSIHRLLQQLQADGYLQVNLRGLIVPSDRLQRIAMGVLYASRHKALRQSILQRLAKETGETCGIAIPDGIDMVYYDRVQSNWPLQIHLPVGSHVPVWCSASGKLYLSSFPRARRQQILRSLPLQRLSRNTITPTATATERAMQRSPEEPKAAPSSELTALSRSASGITMAWFFAPPSAWQRLPLAAAVRYMRSAMGVEPTKLTACTRGSCSRASTASLSPLTTFSTPGGRPASVVR
ncbi:hypothetical protein GCM10027514_25350 [Azotobacter armeniacus]